MTVYTAWLAFERALLVRVDGAHPAHEMQMTLTYLSAQARQINNLAVVLDHTRLTTTSNYTAMAGSAFNWRGLPLALVYAKHPLTRYRVAATFDLLEIPTLQAGRVPAAYAKLQAQDHTLPEPLPPTNAVWLTRIRGATVTDLDGSPDQPRA